jgi:hypothetical protein
VTKDASATGLAPPSTQIEQALKLAWEVHDANAHLAQALEQLVANLKGLMLKPDAKTLTRPNIVALLRSISDGLGPVMHVPLGQTSTGELIVTDHAAIALLDELVDAFSDLENGKTHTVFKPVSHGATATLTVRQRKRDQVWREAVHIVKQFHGLRTVTDAERFLAKKLREAGKKRKGKAVTAAMLKSLRDHPKKPLRSSS